jgi:hypothetical protein
MGCRECGKLSTLELDLCGFCGDSHWDSDQGLEMTVSVLLLEDCAEVRPPRVHRLDNEFVDEPLDVQTQMQTQMTRALSDLLAEVDQTETSDPSETSETSDRKVRFAPETDLIRYIPSKGYSRKEDLQHQCVKKKRKIMERPYTNMVAIVSA